MSYRKSLATTAVVLALGPAAAPAAAQNTCEQDVSPTYTDRCGPSFVLPTWGDGGGWTQPEQYETIQLADVDGDGEDELLARTPAGLAIHDFDKTFGQWRPHVTPRQVPAGGTRLVPVILTEFANPPSLTTANPNPPETDWTEPRYYDTIQTANIDGRSGEEIIARSADGVIVFTHIPSPSRTPGQGTWIKSSTSGPYTDAGGWAPAPYSSTMQTGDFDGDGDAELLARGGDGIHMYSWNVSSSTWSEWNNLAFLPDSDGGANPAYYTSLQTARLTGTRRQMLVGRNQFGIDAYKLRYSGNTSISRFSSPFSDQPLNLDCPFSTPGSTCFGSGPAYYDTIQFADIDGNGRDELLGRASDGLRVRRYQGDTPNGWAALPTLTDLSDANGYTAQKYWETIQAADINGDGRAEVLARDKDGLNAWSYNPASRSWTKLSPSTPLQLADDPWGSDRSYYSTIQTGDVDGDGRADVIARGPYGIRTWFYNRRGTGGWERYLPDGYPDFPTRACTGDATPPCGEQAAYAALNARAQGTIPGGGSTVRSVWTGQSPPAKDDLSIVQNAVLQVAHCTTQLGATPPQYGTCTPSPSSNNFTATEWTSVVNEILAEIFWAGQVWDHFYDSAAGVQTIWSILLQEQLTQLPQIRDQLQLAGPDQTTIDYNPGELFSVLSGSVGAIAALIPGADLVVPPLWLTSELTSAIPSSSTDLLAPFKSSYSNLKSQFANGVTQADKALASHSSLVRGDLRLLTLVGQLRFQGSWELDPNGMRSAARQGFAIWLYKTLLPTVWARYPIRNCQHSRYIQCAAPPAGPWLQGSAPNFTSIGPAPTLLSDPYSQTPCPRQWDARDRYYNCDFVAPPGEVANILWGRMPANCAYNGNPNTIWTFPDTTQGGCTLGVDPAATLADPATVSASREWGFPSYPGNPVVGDDVSGSVSGLTGAAAAGATAAGGRAVGTRSDGAVVRLRATVTLQRTVRLRRARVVFDRILFQGGGVGELVRHRSGRKLPPLSLARLAGASSGIFATRGGRGPRVRLRMVRRGGRLALRLAMRDVRLARAPTACNGTRPGVDFAVDPVQLQTRLRVLDGRRRPLPISLPLQWRCRRDRVGAVRRLVLEPPAYRRPSGTSPAVAFRGPRRLASGRSATYTITVRNRRRTTAKDVIVRASLAPGIAARRVRGARVRGRQVRWRWGALRAGRTRSVRLPVHAGRRTSARTCHSVVVSAIDTRSASRRFCLRIVRVGRERRP